MQKKIEEFVKLCAGGIIPSTSDYWEEAYKLFPDGLLPSVAMQLLKVCLHPQIAVKYLAVDGKFASKFVSGLNLFCQPDHFLQPSKHELPASIGTWTNQVVYGQSDDRAVIEVPFLADGELQVVIQAISAFSLGKIHMQRWRSQTAFVMNDGYDSDGANDEKHVASVNRLRRIEPRPQVVPVASPPAAIPWAYRSLPGLKDYVEEGTSIVIDVVRR